MKPSQFSENLLKILLMMFMTCESGVRGELCPPGEVTHQEEGRRTMCCLPVECDPNHYLVYCSRNGTEDRCEPCPRKYALYKRTSSFSVEPCQVFALVPKTCQPLPGNPRATEDDKKNCYCDLEKGEHYMRPQVPLGPTSFCQPHRRRCSKGEQPNQRGDCEPCPKNTVQDQDNIFRLCRPQRNCSAMRLATEIMGDSKMETVCAKPPSLPTRPPPIDDKSSTPPVVPQVKTSSRTTKVVVVDNNPASVAPVLDDSSRNGGLTIVHIVLVSVGSFTALLILIVLLVMARQRRWCVQGGLCHGGRDVENRQYPVSQLQISNHHHHHHDNDNISDDSCCGCADSCLASSSSSSKGACNGNGKAGARPCKTPVPMLEAYMNSKCVHINSEDNSSFSEAIYNSISHDESKLGEGNLASYKNINGVPPTPLRQSDFYNYPSKVRLPSMEDGEEGGRGGDGSLKKGPEAGLPHGVGKGNKDREDFSETDPLLPNSESASSGTPTPVAVPAPRGILRNGNANNHDPYRGGRFGEGGCGAGEGGVGVAGNRPNLSMLLNSVTDSSQGGSSNSNNPAVAGVAPAAHNVPYLTLLMSTPHSGGQQQQQQHLQAQQHQQSSAAQQEPPPQHVHELPPQLQQHLLQQQKLQQQQLQQQQNQQLHEGSTLPLRLVHASSVPQVDRSSVQMDELKPVMPLNAASPTATTSTTAPVPPHQTPAGAANVATETKPLRGGSPARISPSQQKEVKGGKGQDTVGQGGKTAPPETGDDVQNTKKPERTARDGTTLDEETFKKRALPEDSAKEGGQEEGGGGDDDDEETAHKSVGGSSGLGDSLDISSPLSMPSDEGRRSRALYRRSNSEASRSVSPPLPLPPSRSISSPEDKHRPYAVVKPMQSDQSLNAMSSSQDRLTELTQPLDAAVRNFPLHSLRPHTPRRQSSQESTDDPDLTRPKTPDCLSEEEEGEEEGGGEEHNNTTTNTTTAREETERTRTRFYGENDISGRREEREEETDGTDKPAYESGNEG